MKKENNERIVKKQKTRIIITPHYVGKDKADVIIKGIIAEEIKKKFLNPHKRYCKTETSDVL